jgi:hypothetical protein
MDQSLLKSTIGYPNNNFGIRDFKGSLVSNNMTASFIANNHHMGNLSSRNLSVTQSTVILWIQPITTKEEILKR